MTETNIPSDYWTRAEVMKGIFETKLCLAKPHSPDACQGKIIAAHTIPYSQLQQIATDGHVMAVAATAHDLAKNDGNLTFKSIGIRNFSVLNSFCETHDNNIFKHIEDDPLVFSPHQLTLLHYRTIASEMYRKVMSYKSSMHLIEELKTKRPIDNDAIALVQAIADGELLGIRDIGAAFDRSAKNLFAAKYDDVSALLVHFKKLPSIMTVGSFLPQHDYDAKPLQLIYDFETVAEVVAFNVLAAQGHAVLAMLWFKDHTLVKPLADSFIAQSSDRYSTLAIQTAFEYLENTCVQPSWWNSQKEVIRNILVRRMQNGGNPFEKRKAGCLMFCGITFDQWDYDKHEFLNIASPAEAGATVPQSPAANNISSPSGVPAAAPGKPRGPHEG